MHRIDGPGATITNQFTEGDPGSSVPATVVTADWLNALQEEISGVIEGAGDTLDKPDNGQLLAAIQTLITDAIPPPETPVISAEFESSEQSVPTTASAVSVAHGLGVVPKMFSACIRCKTTEHGYAVGDEINLEMTYASSSTRGGVVFANATNVGASVVGSTYILNKSTGAGAFITEANWRLVFRAFA